MFLVVFFEPKSKMNNEELTNLAWSAPSLTRFELNAIKIADIGANCIKI